MSFERLDVLNFLNILLRCAFTVCSERERDAAISLLVHPRQTKSMISLSLSVTPSPLAAGSDRWPLMEECLERVVVHPHLSFVHHLEGLFEEPKLGTHGRPRGWEKRAAP